MTPIDLTNSSCPDATVENTNKKRNNNGKIEAK